MKDLLSASASKLLFCSVFAGASFSVMSAPIGMVVNNTSKDVVIFDSAANTIIGSVNIGNEGLLTGDCSITADEKLAFVTNFNYELKVIDLTDPTLPLVIDTVAISNAGEDTSISPDQSYVVATDGGRYEPLSVVDIVSRTEIDSFDVSNYDHNSVEVLSDGTVLTTSYYAAKVFKLSLDESGNLTDTGLSLDVLNASNVYADPSATSGFTAQRYPGKITSFLIDSMTAVDERTFTGDVQSAVFHPAGDKVFVRTSNGHIVAYGFNASTGSLSEEPIFDVIVDDAISFFGIEKITVSADGERLYLPSGSTIAVLDSTTGVQIAVISDESLNGSLTGICFASQGAVTTQAAPGLHKVLTNGPDADESGSIDLVVQAGQSYPAQYEFDIRYINPEGPEVVINDKFSSNWNAQLINDDNGNALSTGKSDKGPSAFEWTPQASGGTVSLWAETRSYGSKKKPTFVPKACGALKIGSKATALELDPITGKPMKDEFGEKLPPVMESNELCIAVVKDLNGDGIQRDGGGDEDGDGITDLVEACEIGSDPCSEDTDFDGILDAVDVCPLVAPILDIDGDGCED